METNFLQLYLLQTMQLAQTIVIKSEETASRINQSITEEYGPNAVDIYRPETWRYYMNLSGEYHPLDVPMRITSLDTLEEIIFNKENLKYHKSTRKAYAFGSSYYEILVQTYPEQTSLILGILNPCDLTAALNAKNHTILSYPSYLVEFQEATLIADLQQFIYNYNERWDVQAYGLSNDLYPIAQLAQLSLAIYPKLLALRLRRCKTNEAHTFHIREYLASHGGLDRYMPYMTLKQTLYFYRNVLYIERHAGHSEQFTELIEHILTERRISISEYSVRQLTEFDDQLFPELWVRKKPLNTQYNVPEKDTFTMEELAFKEYPLAKQNELFYQDRFTEVVRDFKTAGTSVVQTKDLESVMFDYNNAVPDPLEEVLRREWISHAISGHYTSVINFKDPVTSEKRQLRALDAYIYMMYVMLYASGIRLTKVPKIFNEKEVRRPLPTVGELLEVFPNPKPNDIKIAEHLLIAVPVSRHFFSTSQFYEYGYALYEENRRQWYLVSNTHDLERRAYIQNMVYRLHRDVLYPSPYQEMDIGAWLEEKHMPVYAYELPQAQQVVYEIFTAAVGIELDPTRIMSNIQKAMISLLTKLSSYSIQIIREGTIGDILPLNNAAMRVGNLKNKAFHDENVDVDVRIDQQDAVCTTTVHMTPDSPYDFVEIDINAKHHQTVVNKTLIDAKLMNRHLVKVHLNRVTIGIDSSPSHYPGIEFFDQLSSEQKKSFLEMRP